jgi:hypothetical protein
MVSDLRPAPRRARRRPWWRPRPATVRLGVWVALGAAAVYLGHVWVAVAVLGGLLATSAVAEAAVYAVLP